LILNHRLGLHHVGHRCPGQHADATVGEENSKLNS
jgi:hypothetical protein